MTGKAQDETGHGRLVLMFFQCNNCVMRCKKIKNKLLGRTEQLIIFQ